MLAITEPLRLSGEFVVRGLSCFVGGVQSCVEGRLSFIWDAVSDGAV